MSERQTRVIRRSITCSNCGGDGCLRCQYYGWIMVVLRYAALVLVALWLSGCATVITVTKYDDHGRYVEQHTIKAQLWVDPGWVPNLRPTNDTQVMTWQ